MKKRPLVLVAVLFVLTATIAQTKDVPTEAQLQQLFESIQREVPDKVRVISLLVKETTPPSQVEIKKAEDSTRKMQEKIQEGVPEPLRTQRIEENVRLRRSVMTGITYKKIQEWKSGSLYRLDKAIGWYSLEEADKKTNYDTTYINLVETTNGTTSTVTMNRNTKSFEINRDKRSLWTEVGAWNAMTVEPQVAFNVGFALASKDSIERKAEDENQKLIIDQAKLQRVLSGQDPIFKVYLEEKVVNGEQLDRFEFDVENGAGTVSIECNKTNYNRITQTEIITKNAELVLSSIRTKYDSQDFPHEYTLIDHENNRYTTNKFFIKEVELNARFSDDEIFRFAPPKNYGVVDMSSGTPKIESFPGGVKPSRIIDVSTPLKEPSWFESRTIIRVVICGVFLLPLLAVMFFAFKKRRSK